MKSVCFETFHAVCTKQPTPLTRFAENELACVYSAAEIFSKFLFTPLVISSGSRGAFLVGCHSSSMGFNSAIVFFVVYSAVAVKMVGFPLLSSNKDNYARHCSIYYYPQHASRIAFELLGVSYFIRLIQCSKFSQSFCADVCDRIVMSLLLNGWPSLICRSWYLVFRGTNHPFPLLVYGVHFGFSQAAQSRHCQWICQPSDLVDDIRRTHFCC